MLKQSVIDNMKEIAEHCMGEETAACVATCPMHKCKRICSINPGRERRRGNKSYPRPAVFTGNSGKNLCAPLRRKMQMERREESYGDCILKKICSRSF